MRVAIIENTAITHHGLVGVALHEAAARIEVFKPHAGQPLPADATDHDAIVVLGGEQSALADASHPYLPHLVALLQDFTHRDRAVLGICLGAQLLARACGATNLIGTAPEFGWCEVSLTAEGQSDPVLSCLPAAFPIFEWHADTFTLPDGARHLAASSRAAHQAFRVGRASYGTQFHFEASRAVVAEMNRLVPHLMEQMEPGWHAAHPARAATLGEHADAAGLKLARAWVAQI